MTPPESLKRTNTRLLAGSKGTGPLAFTKIAKVGAACGSIGVVTETYTIDA